MITILVPVIMMMIMMMTSQFDNDDNENENASDDDDDENAAAADDGLTLLVGRALRHESIVVANLQNDNHCWAQQKGRLELR